MCLKTHESFVTDQESFLKHHKLFSMLICEIYDLLTLYQPSPLSSEEIFENLTPFLQSRIRFVLNRMPITSLSMSRRLYTILCNS